MMLLEPGVDMFQRGTSPALLVSAPASKDRPASVASRAFTDFEDDLSDFEDYSQGSSVCRRPAAESARRSPLLERKSQEPDHHIYL